MYILSLETYCIATADRAPGVEASFRRCFLEQAPEMLDTLLRRANHSPDSNPQVSFYS
jgi:hypothetical protein